MRTTKRAAVSLFCLSALAFSTPISAEEESREPAFSFGAIADCQYCNVEGRGRRKFNLSDAKLRRCVHDMNQLDLAFVVHLGDFIDRKFESFSVVGPIFNGLKMPHHHVLGNHDFSVADDKKALVPGVMGLSNRYYTVTVEDWRFIMLDGNDLSFHAYPKDSPEYRKAQTYHATLKHKAPRWNGALGPEQMKWLDDQLSDAERRSQSVVLFCHFPVYPPNAHNLWNADEVLGLIQEHSCVRAYINGHNHAGHYGEKNGVHYLTLQGMVDTEASAWAVLAVYTDRIEVDGREREKDRVLRFPQTDQPKELRP